VTRRKTVPGKENAEANSGAELNIKAEHARSIASLLRYAISLNTTGGLVYPYDAASRSGEPRLALSSRFLQLYSGLLHGVLFCMHRSVMNKLRLPDEGEDMQDFASSVPRIFLPRTPVNKLPVNAPNPPRVASCRVSTGRRNASG
jgi:hypothetical protein